MTPVFRALPHLYIEIPHMACQDLLQGGGKFFNSMGKRIMMQPLQLMLDIGSQLFSELNSTIMGIY